MRPGRILWLAAVVGAAACVERATAPATCPAYCPSGSLTVVDTLLRGAVSRDSAYRGYVPAFHAGFMLAAALPGIDSRAIFQLAPLGVRVALGTDTTTSPIIGVDSLRLFLSITRRDTAAHNLTLALYRLPLGIDSTTTFADLAGAFTDSLAKDSVNIDSLLARPHGKDTLTGDSVAVDTTKRVTVVMKLDSSQAPYASADSGKLALGIRVGADSLASIALTVDTIRWFVKVDSIHGSDTTLVHKLYARGVTFRSFVFDPPPAPFGSMLAVGGVPSARSILRLSVPRAILDSSQIIRGTLILVPAVPASGAPADSFKIEAHTVLADFGAKSPLVFDATRTDTALIRIGATGATDTLTIEITNLVQFWATDTLAPTTVMLRSQAEGANLAEIRFFSSATPASAPVLRLTYAPRFPFGLR